VDDVKKTFEKAAPNYDNLAFTRTERLQYIDKREKDIVLSLFNPQKSSLVLDAAAGTGRWTKLLLEKGCIVISVDLAHNMLWELKKKVGSSGILVNADIEHLPFKDGTFDGMLCVRALKYLPHPKTGLLEFSRVSKIGTLLVFETTNPKNPQVWYDALHGSGPKSLFTLRTLQKWLSENDFQVTTCKGFLWVPFMLYERVTNPTLAKLFERLEGLMDNFLPPVFVRSFYYRCVKNDGEAN
jgi:ubiquinone/menaquinone biosynthesis C-methylase UbiE